MIVIQNLIDIEIPLLDAYCGKLMLETDSSISYPLLTSVINILKPLEEDASGTKVTYSSTCPTHKNRTSSSTGS